MDGRNLIGYKYSALANTVLQSMNPSNQEFIEGQFNIATTEEIESAVQLASKAHQTYQHSSGEARAAFLNAIADEILALDDVLIKRAMQESGLPEGRLKGERGRTVGQLRMFANMVAEGSWVQATIDTAQPERKPFPKADIRKMMVPMGPVVVFTASNFPLAFSTAGGDSASALAAGCPVIVKAHESHLGTNALVAYAIRKAAEKTGMPEGVFSSLNGTGTELGQALVNHPGIKAIAFTGSLRAGKAIFDAAAKRPEPIPVFAEMGSVNPVVVLDSALENRGEALAQQLAGSITLGVGQFCTNPGLIIAKASSALDSFTKQLSENIEKSNPATMLNEGICRNYDRSRKHLLSLAEVQLEGQVAEVASVQAQATVASVAGADFLKDADMQEEIFGPFSLVVRCSSDAEILAVINSLAGQLTGTLMGEAEELAGQVPLIQALQERVGRLIFNAVPTGVEVCQAMQHGGPYPATTDSKTTSVGGAAITRFVRPVAFQSWPDALLPDALKAANPLKIWRMVDGQWTQG